MRKCFFFFLMCGVFCIFSLSTIAAQSNEIMDQLLEQEEASYGLSAYMVLTAIGDLPEEASAQDAVDAIQDRDWGIDFQSADEAITLGEYSYLLMKALNMKGGIMYTIFPCPRYAARELVFLDYVSGNSAAGRILSGSEVIRILGRALEQQGGEA